MEGKIDEYKAKVNYSKTDTFSLGMTILRALAPNQFFKLFFINFTKIYFILYRYQCLLNTNEETMIGLLVEIKDKIPDEIYDILFLMLSFNPNIRPDICKVWTLLNTRHYFEKKVRFNSGIKGESDLKSQIKKKK